MNALHRTAPLLLLVPFLMAMPCAFQQPGGPFIDAPQPGAPVTTASFLVQVTVPAGSSFDPLADVTLNDVALAMTGGPTTFTTTVQPGFPLTDTNVLVARARNATGEETARTRLVDYQPEKARARRITHANDLIHGPLAHSRLGDVLIENDVARFVIQDVGKRDLYSVGAFGGNLIDAELKARPAVDNFLEIQPMLNIETVINAQTLEIVNDGADGLAAIVRTCGPDDLLDFVNPSSVVSDAGLNTFPALADDRDLEIEGCTEYELEPGAPHLRMRTEVFNNQAPGAAIPDLPLFVGDWLNPAGQLDTWSKPEAGWADGLTSLFDAMSFVGVDQAAGAEYAYLGIRNPLFGFGGSSYFSTSGVFFVLHNLSVVGVLLGQPSQFIVPQGGSQIFERVLAVGDGTGAAAVQLEADITGLAVGHVEGCVTVGGTPREGARISFGKTGATGAFTRLDQAVETRSGPCPNYRAPVAPGVHQAVAGRRGAPYEGSAPVPPPQAVVVTAGATTSGVDFALPATGRLDVDVSDEGGSPLPARVTVVGFDPSPELTVPGLAIPGFGGATLSVLHDIDDGLPFGIVDFAHTDVAGRVSFEIEPGSYQVFVSRGTEYSRFETPVVVSGGAVTPVVAQIARVVDTSGFVSSDFHVHGIRSADSQIPDVRRVQQFAAEGLENVVMTDHHVHTDLGPAIAAQGLEGFVTSTIGEEITTFDYGHFNGYPFTIDSSVPSGGSTDWGGAAPPGEDFPSFGNFNATPPEVFALATQGARSLPDTAVQVNHINSHYVPLQIDTAPAGPIQDGLDPAERAILRLPAAGNLFHPFPALELWNGMNRGHQSEFLNGRIGIWFNQLNKGLATTAIADTDTHTFTNLRTAGARTWTASSTDAPESVDPDEVARSVLTGRAVGGQGLYVQTRLLARDGSSGVADLTLGGTTEVVSSNGDVDLEVRVQAPLWAPFDRIEVYANAATAAVDPQEPYLYVAAPGSAQVFLEGDCDPLTSGDGQFDVSIVDVAPGVPGGQRLETTVVVPFAGLAQDTWFVAVVKGTDGSCPPMFPVHPHDLDTGPNATLADLLDGNVGERGVQPLGLTNALRADVDGTPGFQAPNP